MPATIIIAEARCRRSSVPWLKGRAHLLTMAALLMGMVIGALPAGAAPYAIAPGTIPLLLTAVLTTPTAPTTPASLKAVAASSTQVTLTWVDTSTNESQFVLLRKTSTSAYAGLAVLAPNTTHYTDTTARPNTSYSYMLMAANAVGASPWSNEAVVTTPPLPPVAPTSLRATAASPIQVNLQWIDNNDNETQFVLLRKTSNSVYARIAVLAPNMTQYTDTSADPNTSYSYILRAYNSGGGSPWSNEVAVTTPDAPPANPTNLRAMAVSATHVNVTWEDKSSNEIQFVLLRKTAGDPYASIAVLPANTTGYTDTTVGANTAYSYILKAANTIGASPWSNEAAVTTPLMLPPAAPTPLRATATSPVQVTLTWTDPSNEREFVLLRKQGSGLYARVALLPANTTSYTDNSIAPNTTYTYIMRAVNDLGVSAWTNEPSVITPDVPPTSLRNGRPRIWLTPQILSGLRQKAQNGSPRWLSLKKTCDSFLGSTSASSVNVMNYALAYQVTGNPVYADKAIALAQAKVSLGMQAMLISGPHGFEARSLLPEVAIAYDWCYDRLSPVQREQFRVQLEQWADWVWPETNPERATGWAVTNPGNNFYHGFLMTWLVGLALHGDSPKADGYISLARQKYLTEVRPHLDTIAKGGYLLEGTNYGTGVRIFWGLAAHAAATGENLFNATGFEWHKETVLSRIYLSTPTLSRLFPGGDQARDASAPITDYTRGPVLVTLSYMDDPTIAGYAKWWLDHIKPNQNEWRFTQWEEFLWYRDEVTAVDYTQRLSPAYLAPGAGVMTSRSGWDTDAVQVLMVCGPTKESHQDMAQNEFMIFRRDWLAAKARLKAHGGLKRDTQSSNTLLIGGAGQVGVQESAKVRFLEEDPNHRYAYMVGDANDVYDPKQFNGSINVLDEFRRELFYLKPGFVLVFDRVNAVDGQKEKKWLLHTLNEPTVGGGSYQASAGDSTLFGTTLLPQGGQMVKTPLNYGTGGVLSSWRVELVAPLGNKADHFLNVLEAAPASQQAPTPVRAVETSAGVVGAEVGGRAILFTAAPSPVGAFDYTVSSPAVREHYLLTLAPQKGYTATVKNAAGATVQEVEGTTTRAGVAQLSLSAADARTISFRLDGAVENPPSNGGQ